VAHEAGGGDAVIPVGVGVAAMLRDRRGTVANSPHLRWRDVPFGRMLRDRLGSGYRVGVYNDVNAITWGEHQRGAAAGATDVLAVFVGTGIGGGLVANNRLVEGASNCAGEIGHVKVDWSDKARPCNCGKRGCVEAYVGGSYLLERLHTELHGRARSSAVVRAGGAEFVTPGHIDAAAAEGDRYALALWSELAPLLGVALANAVTLTNPARLVLGGGVLFGAPLLREQAVAAFEIACNAPNRDRCEVVDAALGDDAGLIGSALLAAVSETRSS
ncbi:MAG TPA: ROK family protein, partial [Kofleriaceae bacterium]|nr:ROK family protein [Kofleriaceae bacterium]